MANSFKAKNTEILVGTVIDPVAFDPGARTDADTYATYLDTAITSGDVSALTTVSDKKNEFSQEPAEDDAATRLHYGADTSGNQNSSIATTENNDVDISISGDAEFGAVMEGLALTPEAVGNVDVNISGYQAFNLASRTTDILIMFIKIERQLGGVWYVKNYVIEAPVFKKIGSITGSSEDPTLTDEFALLGNKADIWTDDYQSSIAPVYVNF